MAYLVAADFRSETLHEAAAGLALTVDEAEDAALTSAIARASVRFDDYTGDHFESEAALVLTLRGNDGSALYLPRRCTAVSQVRIQSALGVYTIQASTVYRLVSSLETGGARRRSKWATDYLEILPNQYLTGTTYGTADGWPCEANSVEVTGTFGWTVTPADVKKAVATLVYDHFKPIRKDLAMADRWATEDASFTRSASEPSGIPVVDDIVASFTYDTAVGVG